MKGDVGMSALKILFVVQRNNIFTSNCLHEMHCGLERNKYVGMGL